MCELRHSEHMLIFTNYLLGCILAILAISMYRQTTWKKLCAAMKSSFAPNTLPMECRPHEMQNLGYPKKRLSGRRKKTLVSPTPIDNDLSNLGILQGSKPPVDPNNIELFFKKHKHMCKIYGSTKVNGKYLVKNGMYMMIKYFDGRQSWKTKWGLGARGFCAMWCTDHWEPLKIGMQTSFEIPNGIAAEDTQDGFTYSSDKFSQKDIDKIIDFNSGSDNVTYTFKVDGQYLVANVYSTKMSKIILSVLHELYADKVFSVALAEYSMKNYGHVVVLSSNNTWLTPEPMIPSIVTAMWSHFKPDKTYEDLCADKRSFQKVFDEDLREPFLSSLMNFCNTGDETVNDTVHVSFEVCCKNNTPARKEKIHGLAVTSQESALFLLGYHDGEKFHPHSTQECQIRVVDSGFRDPCFWVMNSKVISCEFHNAIMDVVMGKMTENDFFSMFLPHNKRSNPIDSYAFHAEGGVVYVDGRYFKLKTPVYYWVHKPKQHYWDNIMAIPITATKYFPDILRIKAFITNIDKFVIDFKNDVTMFADKILENDEIMKAFVKGAPKRMLLAFEENKKLNPETALKMVINAQHVKEMIIKNSWDESAAVKMMGSTIEFSDKVRSCIFSIMKSNSSEHVNTIEEIKSLFNSQMMG